MLLTDCHSAEALAAAFLRKRATRNRVILKQRRSVETEAAWIFDFYDHAWRYLRKDHQPYGFRIAVDKVFGKASLFAVLQRPIP